MFKKKKKLTYKTEKNNVSVPIHTLEEGTNLTREFIIFKSEDTIKVYSRKCDHAGGKLCKLGEKITCPLHGWEFNPESGAYENLQFVKKEEDFSIENDEIVIPFKKEILELPKIDKNYDLSIELISHACLIFKSEDFAFATDPWVEGFAFSSGWWPSMYPPKDWVDKLNAVDFIYISHNHPDHLNEFTLRKIRKDMHFIVPKFHNDSVRKLLNRFGFFNISSFEFDSYYNFKDSDLFLTILKSGDFREDSGFYMTYGNFTCLSSVDSNDLNFLKFPENVSVFCSSFAGGASGYPSCFDTIDDDKKPNIIKRNTDALKTSVKMQIKQCKPNYYLPYAGFFEERAVRDSYIKQINIKNKVQDYFEPLEKLGVDTLDTSKKDIFLFNGNKLKKVGNLQRHDKFSEDPLTFYSQEFNNVSLTNEFIEDFFLKSNFQDNLIVYFELSNDDFSSTNRYLSVDFRNHPIVSFKKFDWNSIKDLHIKQSKLRHLRIKVREDSFLWVLKNNMPFEDLSIGFQCRIDRVPDIYNVSFWHHFTNVFIK